MDFSWSGGVLPAIRRILDRLRRHQFVASVSRNPIPTLDDTVRIGIIRIRRLSERQKR